MNFYKITKKGTDKSVVIEAPLVCVAMGLALNNDVFGDRHLFGEGQSERWRYFDTLEGKLATEEEKKTAHRRTYIETKSPEETRKVAEELERLGYRWSSGVELSSREVLNQAGKISYIETLKNSVSWHI